MNLVFCYISSCISLSDDCHVKICKFTALSSGSFCQIYRVTDEALIAETAVWPNFFLMNVFFAFKGSKLFIIIFDIYDLIGVCGSLTEVSRSSLNSVTAT